MKSLKLGHAECGNEKCSRCYTDDTHDAGFVDPFHFKDERIIELLALRLRHRQERFREQQDGTQNHEDQRKNDYDQQHGSTEEAMKRVIAAAWLSLIAVVFVGSAVYSAITGATIREWVGCIAIIVFGGVSLWAVQVVTEPR